MFYTGWLDLDYVKIVVQCTGWPKSHGALVGRPLLEKFISEHYYFSMVPGVSTPEKYDSVVKLFLTGIFFI